MSSIKRLQALKQQSLVLSRRLREKSPLYFLDRGHVSGSGLTYSDLSERLEKVESCSSIIELKETWENHPDGIEQVLEVSAANFCKQHIICPICADRSQARRRARFDRPIKNQALQIKENKRYAYMVTYTIEDGESLAERLEHLKESKRAFMRMGQKRGRRRSGGEAGKIRAAISTIEVKRGSNSKQWHAHCHDLVFTDSPLDFEVYDRDKKKELSKKYGNRIPKEELTKIAKNTALFNGDMVPVSKMSAEWLAASGDSLNINVDRMTHVPKDKTIWKDGRFQRKSIPEKKRRKLMSMSFEESIAYQSKETFKYMTKTMEVSESDSLVLIEDTYNKRMVATYGEFRGIGGDDYNDPASPGESTYIMKWQSDGYTDPQPGNIREEIEKERAHDTRSIAGRLTGRYRRRRRDIMSDRLSYGIGLYQVLDELKGSYRAQIRSLWSNYHASIETGKRQECTCDKYSPLLAVDGKFVPGSDSTTIYQAVFT